MTATVRSPANCPRCTLNAASGFWCCWELAQLRDLMAMAAPPTMRELLTIFAGKSASAIDRACRRYGFKTPGRAVRIRRRRCGACGELVDGAVCACARAAGERQAA